MSYNTAITVSDGANSVTIPLGGNIDNDLPKVVNTQNELVLLGETPPRAPLIVAYGTGASPSSFAFNDFERMIFGFPQYAIIYATWGSNALLTPQTGVYYYTATFTIANPAGAPVLFQLRDTTGVVHDQWYYPGLEPNQKVFLVGSSEIPSGRVLELGVRSADGNNYVLSVRPSSALLSAARMDIHLVEAL